MITSMAMVDPLTYSDHTRVSLGLGMYNPVGAKVTYTTTSDKLYPPHSADRPPAGTESTVPCDGVGSPVMSPAAAYILIRKASPRRHIV